MPYASCSQSRDNFYLQKSSVADPEPHNFGKLDPDPDQFGKLDPDPHHFGKLDPDRHQVKGRIQIHINGTRWKPLEGHFGAMEGPNLEKSGWYDTDPDPHPIER
jgi:hypothetical protein